MRRFACLIFVVLSAICTPVWSQSRVSVGFYNVENMCDTLPSMFYDDSEWTPEGRRQWNTERYDTKLRNIARVVDDAGFDVLGIAEVESEDVVRDLVMTLSDDYNYIHRTTSDSRGMDIALLYKGDKFYPERVRQIPSGTSRGLLCVRGRLNGSTVNIVVCHLPSRINKRGYRAKAIERLRNVTDSLMSNDGEAQLIVMGDFNCSPDDADFKKFFGRLRGEMYDRSLMVAGIGSSDKVITGGSYAYNGRWMLYDNILLSLDFARGAGSLSLCEGGVFVRDYMLFDKLVIRQFPGLAGMQGYPRRTFSTGVYTAGYSDHLPVYVILESL